MRNCEKHVAAEGGSWRLAIQNIVCHLDLLTDEQKAAINWHPEQSVSLAVMRLISIDDFRGLRHMRDCLIDTETGTRWRELRRREIDGSTWVDLALEDGTELARSVRLSLFERIFKPMEPQPTVDAVDPQAAS